MADIDMNLAQVADFLERKGFTDMASAVRREKAESLRRRDEDPAQTAARTAGEPKSLWVVTHVYDDGHVHRETVMTEYGYFTDEGSCEDFIKEKYGHWEDRNSVGRPDGYNRYYAEEIEPAEEAPAVAADAEARR